MIKYLIPPDLYLASSSIIYILWASFFAIPAVILLYYRIVDGSGIDEKTGIPIYRLKAANLFNSHRCLQNIILSGMCILSSIGFIFIGESTCSYTGGISYAAIQKLFCNDLKITFGIEMLLIVIGLYGFLSVVYRKNK